MASENKLVYVKLESDEAIDSKKDFLNSRLLLIELVRILKSYELTRKSKENLEKQLLLKIKSFNLNIGKINNSFPKVIVPKNLTKKRSETKKRDKQEVTEIKIKENGLDLENELRELQEKIKQLEQGI